MTAFTLKGVQAGTITSDFVNVPGATVVGDIVLACLDYGRQLADFGYEHIAPRVWSSREIASPATIGVSPGPSVLTDAVVLTLNAASPEIEGVQSGAGSSPFFSVPAKPGTESLLIITVSGVQNTWVFDGDVVSHDVGAGWVHMAGVGDAESGNRQFSSVNIYSASTTSTTPPASLNLSPIGAEELIWHWALLSNLRVSTYAPAARKYPRSDGRGFGSGRIFPPPSTQQSGRLNAPY